MKKIFYFLIFFLVGCAGSSSASKSDAQPNWINNPAALYSSKKYIAVLGTGDNLSQAQNNASSSISKIFDSNIVVDNSLNQEYIEILSSEGLFQNESTQSTSKVSVKSDQKLFNIKFGESFTNQLGKVYTIAYIDRQETAQIYEEKIMDNHDKILFFTERASRAKDIMEQYAYTKAAHTFSTINQELIEQLGIISQDEKEMLILQYSHSLIAATLRELANKIGFWIEIKNDQNSRVKNILVKVINDLGFPISPKPLLTFVGDIRFSDVDLEKENQEFIVWELNLSMKDRENRIIFSVYEKGREGGINRSSAVNKTYYQIEKRFKEKLKSDIYSYFNSSIK